MKNREQWLSRFEQKTIDDLAISMIDPYANESALQEQSVIAAQMLGCTPAQAAIRAAKVATSVLTVTRRHEGFFGAAQDDFYFDLDQAKEILRFSRSESGPPRPGLGASDE